MKHDTEGWKSLETSMRILQNMVEALGTDFLIFDFSPVVNVLQRGSQHINRFVREVCFFLVAALFDIALKSTTSTLNGSTSIENHKQENEETSRFQE